MTVRIIDLLAANAFVSELINFTHVPRGTTTCSALLFSLADSPFFCIRSQERRKNTHIQIMRNAFYLEWQCEFSRIKIDGEIPQEKEFCSEHHKFSPARLPPSQKSLEEMALDENGGGEMPIERTSLLSALAFERCGLFIYVLCIYPPPPELLSSVGYEIVAEEAASVFKVAAALCARHDQNDITALAKRMHGWSRALTWMCSE